jgi:hypothetical protein
LFLKYQELDPEFLPPERWERATSIAVGLPNAEVVEIERRSVKLRMPETDDLVDGDVSRTGFTVYLGGFDWVTYPTPQYLLQKFPDLMPLPQQVFNVPDEDL